MHVYKNDRVKNQHDYFSIYKDSLVRDYSKKLSFSVPLFNLQYDRVESFLQCNLKASSGDFSIKQRNSRTEVKIKPL